MIATKTATVVFILQCFVFCGLTPALMFGQEARQKNSLLDSLTTEQYTQLIRGMSEPDGSFHSENFTSNESSYLHPLQTLRVLGLSGGVYIGVGPEQNFTYIAETKPDMAFIVDIRRQNLLLHFIYKAIFELADSRVDFLSILFCKPIHEDFTEWPSERSVRRARPDLEKTIAEIVGYFDSQQPDTNLYVHNLSNIRSLVLKYGIEASDDLKAIEHIYGQFFKRQFEIKYDMQAPPGFEIPNYPNLRDLLLSTTLDGELANFLAKEGSFRYVKTLQRKNLIVPIVGDFAGDKALRSITEYVLNHESTVSVFYTSNVELYLATQYPNREFLKYFETVFSMPTDASSVFIRSYANDVWRNMMDHPDRVGNHLFTTFVQPMSYLPGEKSWLSMRGYDRYIHLVTKGNLMLD